MARNLAATETNVSEAVFADFYSEWMAANRACKTENAKRNLVLKRAKAAGVPIDAMRAVEKLRQLGSDTVEQQAKEMSRVAAWMGVPLYTQASMFSDEEKPTPSAAVSAEFARTQGYECGKQGGDRINGNPFVPGSPHHVSFDQGYMTGQALIAEGLMPTAKKANVSKTKPGEEPRKRGRPSNASRMN